MQTSAWTTTIIYLVIFVGIVYFLTIRPQQKNQKRRQEMLSKLKVNDKIVTIGGMIGRITRIKDDTITLRVADKVEVEFQKNAVSYVLGAEENQQG